MTAPEPPTPLESQRRPVPRDDDGELDTALAFLRFARESVLKKLDGLDEAQQRQVLVASGTSLLGLVAHLADGERYWFGHTLGGRGRAEDWDFSMDTSGRRGAEVVAGYRAAIAESDDVIARLGSAEATTAEPVDGRHMTLRWVVAHMTSETARHAGHADVLREQIDGVTGR